MPAESHKNNSSVRLGLMPPLSGIARIYGEEITWAARIACDEINDRGGVLGRKLELVIRDDGSLPDTAVPAAEHLVLKEKCSAIIGNLLSNSRIAVASRIADRYRIPYLNFSFYEGSIKSRYFFHFAALPNQQIDKMIPYMAKHFGAKFFFAGSNYEWPRGSIDAAKKALIGVGGEIVGEEYVPLGTQNFDFLLKAVARSGADVFVPYFAGEDQINLLNQFTEKGLKKRMAVVMGHYDEAMVRHLEPHVRAGFYSSNTYFMGIDSPENRSYMEKLSAQEGVRGIWPKGNGVLTNFGEGTYLCVHAFAMAANMAGSLESEDLVRSLEEVKIAGLQGPVSMDRATHHAAVNSYLARCNSTGWFEIIESFGQIEPEIPARYLSNIVDIPRPKGGKTTVSSADGQKEGSLLDDNAREKILGFADIAIISTDEEGKILQINDHAGKLFGYSSGEIIGHPVHLLVPPHLREIHERHFRVFLQSPDTHRSMSLRNEISAYRKDGSEFPAEASVSKFRGSSGWVTVVTLRDISDRKEREQQLLWQATHDSLTLLPNRSQLKDRLERALQRTARTKDKIAVLFIDLDGFKLVNDSYGHDVGDRLLMEISERLVDTIRPGDTLARFGGDEFVILCEQIQEEAAIFTLAERILKILQHPILIDSLKLFIGASIGIATGSGNSHSADDLLRNADAAMYQAKDHGRNTWRIFNDELHENAIQQLVIANGLRTAIENAELSVEFQPIVDANKDIIVGAESLLRWRPGGRPVSPELFIPVSETTGIINEIGAWVYEQACLAVRRLESLSEKIRPQYISVNVSARQLDDQSLLDVFDRILRKTGVNPSSIVLEITETFLMRNVQRNIEILTSLGKMGHKIAVDDFGTGYSSLSHLVRLPINTIKVDKSFVDDIQHEKSNREIAAAIISMAHALGHKVIAEGVETPEQSALLQSIGCDLMQGYLFYRPMPLDRLLSSIAEQKGPHARHAHSA